MCIMDTRYEQISANLFDLMVILHKKIFNPLEISKAVDLTPAQFSVLFYLIRNENCSVSEVARYLRISKPNMTPLLDRLIDLGYIQRTRDMKDRRVIRLRLTERGKSFYDSMKEANLKIVRDIFQNYDNQELEMLQRYSRELLDSLSEVSGLSEDDGLQFAEKTLTVKP